RSTAQQKIEKIKNGILVIDKRAIDSRLFPPDSSQGFTAALVESNGILSFEIQLPLNLKAYFPKFGSCEGKEKISLGLSLAGFSTERALASPEGGYMPPTGGHTSHHTRGDPSN